ncbi:SDR family oxidoreductase [Gordonia phosphorivorans]|uniref:SDR family oxidoreductase n=1 Tax=Gordonia phosphorivorans TaxID=1056982 RepID=A0ABV6HB04_9ACTN
MTRLLVTGACGLLGRRVLSRLLDAPGSAVTALVPTEDLPRLAALCEELDGGDRVTAVVRLDDESLESVDHVIHLGRHGVPDPEETARLAEFARARGAMLHHLSSITVSGDHGEAFAEDHFDLGQDFPTAAHRAAFDAEKAVRDAEGLRWRIYRPSTMVGDSTTGEMDRIDGPYYFFPWLRGLGKLPSFLPLPVFGVGFVNVVPVDYVADALVALLDYAPDESGRVFHLADPERRTLTELFNALAPALDAPRGFDLVPGALARPLLAVTSHSPLRMGRDLVVQQLGIPPETIDDVPVPKYFLSDTSTATLEELGVVLPELSEYGPRLWTYWNDHLDPSRHRRDDERGPLVGKNIIITGGSSGIGKATARMCITRGANVILVSREADQLIETVDELNAELPKPGFPLGVASAYPADITDEAAVRTLVKSIIAEHDHIDVLVNNAGRSIRRASINALDRAHDYQRLMAVNYFGAVYLTLSVLPHMIERQSGHIVNASSVEVQSRAPRFGAYAASKAALEAFADATGAETLSDHVTFTNVRLPITRTRMIAPTRAYESRRGIWGVDKAANRILKAIIERPKRVNSLWGDIAEFGHWAAPRLTNRIMHQEYLAVAESEAALGIPPS